MTADFDPAHPDFGENPWPAYARLRDMRDLPLWQGFHMASRFDDVRTIASDRRMVRGTGFLDPDTRRQLQVAQNFHDMPFHERFVQTSMLEVDGPDHDRLRRAVFPFFTRMRLESLRPFVAQWVDAALERLIPQGRFDFIADLAAHLPGQVIGHLIGTDPALAPQMTRWSDDTVGYFDISRRTPDRKARAEDATRLFHDALQDLHTRRKATRRDDLMSTLIGAEDAGLLSHDELIGTAMQLLHAGHGSTIDAMGSGLHALMSHPCQMARLRADPGLMPSAVQEIFRFVPPLVFFHRHASCDLTICGQDWPQGTTFGLLYAAANRDGAAFPDPDRFDIARRPNLHLAFGAGPHVCLGNNLARLTTDVLFTALLARTRSIEPAGRPVWKTGLQAHGPASLPITVATH